MSNHSNTNYYFKKLQHVLARGARTNQKNLGMRGIKKVRNSLQFEKLIFPKLSKAKYSKNKETLNIRMRKFLLVFKLRNDNKKKKTVSKLSITVY